MAFFNGNLRRGLGSRNIPQGRPIVQPFFSGASGVGTAGHFRTAGASSGGFSSEWTGEYGSGTNTASVGLTIVAGAVAGAGSAAVLTHALNGMIPTVAASGRAGAFNIAAGANRSFPIRTSASGAGVVGTMLATTPLTAQSASGVGRAGTLVRGPINALTGAAGHGAAGSVAFSAPSVTLSFGTTTYTIPGGITRVYVECWGSGAMGGSSWFEPQGGGGGAYAAGYVTVTPGSVIPIQIGGGAQNSSPDLYNGGDDGQATWFKDTSTIYADGGKGGNNDPAFAVANGGKASSSVGTVTYSGGSGLPGAGFPNYEAGSGGGSAGKHGAGVNASSSGGGRGDNALAGLGGAFVIAAGVVTGGSGQSNVEGGGGGGGANSTDGNTATPGAGGTPGGGSGGLNGSNTDTSVRAGDGQIRISFS